MSETTNYHLHLTDNPNERFYDWREAMNGLTDSNMIKIDTALGEKAEASVQVNGTLTAIGWSEVNGVYQQTISVTGLSATQNGSIGVADTASAAQREAARNASLIIIDQSAGSLTIAVEEDVPQVDIPVTIILLG